MKRRGFLRSTLAGLAVALELNHWAGASIGPEIEEAIENEPVIPVQRFSYPAAGSLYEGEMALSEKREFLAEIVWTPVMEVKG